MANCGMRVAMDIGVIHDDVNGAFTGYLRRSDCDFGCKFSCEGMAGHWFTVAKGCGERWMSLSVNLALGGGNRVIRAQRIC